jgi:hypothetical protein
MWVKAREDAPQGFFERNVVIMYGWELDYE